MKELAFAVKTFDELSLRELYEILRARAEVFVKEQEICCVDPDGTDYVSLHVFSMREGRVEAYLRAYRTDPGTVKIGRVFAIPHGSGLGTALMRFALRVIPERMECRRFVMDAQKQAIPFYERLGFQVTSGEYLEEGILHVDMAMELPRK